VKYFEAFERMWNMIYFCIALAGSLDSG
jgi:hypothetical protein